MKPLPLMLALGIVGSALSAHADGDIDRRALQHQRSALDAQLARDVGVCETRFAVNACLDEVRARHSAAVSPLTARLEALEAGERIGRAAAQRVRVAERQREFEVEDSRRRAEALKATGQPDPDIAASAVEAAASNPPRRPQAANPEERAKQLRRQAAAAAQTAQKNRSQLAARQYQQQLRVQDQQQRAEARARSGKKPVAALPLPTQAEVAAAVASAGSAPRP